MTKRVLIESQIKRDMKDKLMSFLRDKLPAVRGFDGCLCVNVLLDDTSGKMILMKSGDLSMTIRSTWQVLPKME